MAALFSRLRNEEPALLTSLLTLIGGFVAQAGPGHIASLKALGTSVTVTGVQGLLTRERVISPATVRSGASAVDPLDIASLVRPWLAQGAEPAFAMGLVGFLVGFLLQVVGGSTNLMQALGIAAGLAGTQALITRQQVYSPRSVAAGKIAAASGLTSAVYTALAGEPVTAPAGAEAPLAPAAIEPAAAPATAATVSPVVSPKAVALDAVAEPALTTVLQRYRPEVRYDSLESYFADSAAVLTDHPGNVLKRQDGTVLAAVGPVQGVHALDLAFLGPRQYASGQPVMQSDFIQEASGDYVAQAAMMHSLAGYADRVHGRVVVDSTGARWLQYWFFMYYDDPGFLGFGTHQGDIEMIQLRLDASGQPDVASYSQHRSGVRAAWSQLELAASPDGPVPVTYSARGSHANLLRAGTQVSLRSFLPDHNNGLGRRIRPDLVVLSDTLAPWSLWPGSWGGTRASGIFGDIGVAANSPVGANRHLAWRDPAGFHAGCDLPDDLPPRGQHMGLELPGPPKATLSVDASPAGTAVRFSVPPTDKAPMPAKIVVGLVAKDSPAPARIATADLRAPSGTVELPAPPKDTPVEVHASVYAENGVVSPTAIEPVSL